MKKYLALALCALPISGFAARGPKPVCDGKLVIENVTVQLLKANWPAEFLYRADITNKSAANVSYSLRFTGYKSIVTVVKAVNKSATIVPGKSDRTELGRTILYNGNEAGLNDAEIESAMQVTCK